MTERTSFMKKVFENVHNIDAIKGILKPVADGLLQSTANYSLTVIYINLKWCGFAYKFFEYVLGLKQYRIGNCQLQMKQAL